MANQVHVSTGIYKKIKNSTTKLTMEDVEKMILAAAQQADIDNLRKLIQTMIFVIVERRNSIILGAKLDTEEEKFQLPSECLGLTRRIVQSTTRTATIMILLAKEMFEHVNGNERMIWAASNLMHELTHAVSQTGEDTPQDNDFLVQDQGKKEGGTTFEHQFFGGIFQRQAFLGAIGLALIPADIVESTWTDIMDLHTPDDVNATEFNDYLFQTYVDISLYGINIWNVHDAIINDLPRTNNHVEGYNRRLESNFPKHPHIYHFIELLRDEHLYQHHRAEESDMQIRKRKKLYNNIDSKLKELHEEHIKGTITNV
ncbi:unnamed protein product [Didymodactylos carnosus]|uniref:Uncharacterized protein n=1 Tax=Didymodactylos carnosus TaxID=1234261 RepID=A0A815ARA3_9BILA|nr:unnamed protein product [Didymodactylos carnosus]CAF4037525.1 unnamed protein product [Didymodactylos carnosus]